MTSYDGLLRRARVRTSTRPHGRGTAVFSDMAFSYVSLVSHSRLDLLTRNTLRVNRFHPYACVNPTPAAKVRHVLLEIRFLEGDRDLNNHYEGCAPLALQRMRERM